MRIENANIQRIVSAYKTPPKSGVKSNEGYKKDDVTISKEGLALQKLSSNIKDIPDRIDLINSIKTSIENGTYKIDAGKIASKMIERVNTDGKHI